MTDATDKPFELAEILKTLHAHEGAMYTAPAAERQAEVPTAEDDRLSREASLMTAKPKLCNGQATGFQCKHYWGQGMAIDVPNAHHLRYGRKNRLCLVMASEHWDLGEEGREMLHYCTLYEPSTRKYDPDFEVFNPLSPEDAEALLEARKKARAEGAGSLAQLEVERLSFDDVEKTLQAKEAPTLDEGIFNKTP